MTPRRLAHAALLLWGLRAAIHSWMGMVLVWRLQATAHADGPMATIWTRAAMQEGVTALLAVLVMVLARRMAGWSVREETRGGRGEWLRAALAPCLVAVLVPAASWAVARGSVPGSLGPASRFGSTEGPAVIERLVVLTLIGLVLVAWLRRTRGGGSTVGVGGSATDVLAAGLSVVGLGFILDAILQTLPVLQASVAGHDPLGDPWGLGALLLGWPYLRVGWKRAAQTPGAGHADGQAGV